MVEQDMQTLETFQRPKLPVQRASECTPAGAAGKS